jgi:hypothetical protein
MKAEKLSGLVMRDHHEAVFVQVAFAKRKDVDELLELPRVQDSPDPVHVPMPYL